MRRVGWLLLVLAFVLALTAAGSRQFFGGEPGEIIVVSFLLLMLMAISVLVVSAVSRLIKGEVRLRPWDATRRALPLFAIVLGGRLVFYAIFPKPERDLTIDIVSSVAFAVFYGLYTTAYRRTV